jgi:hypothetical protein
MSQAGSLGSADGGGEIVTFNNDGGTFAKTVAGAVNLVGDGTNISVTGDDSNTMTVSFIGSTQIPVVFKNGGSIGNPTYILVECFNGVSVNFPVTGGVIFALYALTANGWTITQSAGQQIQFGNAQSTLGVGGSLSSNAIGDMVWCLKSTFSNTLLILGSMGNPTIV